MARTLVLLLIVGALGLSGCSVVMATSGKPTPDLSTIKVGSTRGEVEALLGAPVQSVTSSESGNRTDTYECEIGNDPSAGRAIGNAVMDVLSLGLYEVVGTPSEALRVAKHRVQLEYGPDDKVVKILPPPNAGKPGH